MKRNITKEDLATLSDSQKVSLRELWLPEKYDLAVAYICKNAETEEYDEIEFVVGNLLLHHNHITLIDIRRPKDEKDEDVDGESSLKSSVFNNDANESDLDEEEEENEDEIEEELDEDFSDEDFEFAYEQPTTFSKEDCLPLLSITQMIEILDRKNFKDVNFYLSTSYDDKACEIGNTNSALEDYGNTHDESAELCDVLWEIIKQLL